MCLMLEDADKYFSFPNYTTPVSGTLKEVPENDITTRYKISLNDFVITKDESGGVYTIFKLEWKWLDTILFQLHTQRPHKYANPQDRTIVAGTGVNPAHFFFSQVTVKIKW